jgi:carbamoyl-phosphate synthase large subunit
VPHEKINILVTSAGTASAISVIKALKSQTEIPVRIIAVDLDPMAAGLFLADEYRLVPAATDPAYIQTLINIAEQTHATVLIPIYSKEISIIAGHQQRLKEAGLHTFLPTTETIDRCNNKKVMYAFAKQAGLNVPRVYEKEELTALLETDFPVFVKPNTGSSSTGAEKVLSKERLTELLNSGRDLVVQEFIEAEEVTVDVLCNDKSEAIVIAPRLRLATKSGQSVKGKTLPTKRFELDVKNICSQLNLVGACNIQFFMKGDTLYFIEVNPRFAAGGLMLTVGAGANIPLLLLKMLLKVSITDHECQTKPDYMMTRYWEEIIFEYKK